MGRRGNPLPTLGKNLWPSSAPPVVGSRVAEPSVVRGGAFSRVSREARVLPLGRAGRILVGSDPLEDTGLSSAGDDGPVLLMLMLGRGDRGPSLVFRNWGLEAKLITPGFPRQQLSYVFVKKK
jgi:hypothetical protein